LGIERADLQLAQQIQKLLREAGGLVPNHVAEIAMSV
jgi:hypothetical protein